MTRKYSFWKWAVVIVTVASLLIVPTIGSGADRNSEWRLGGQNLKNTRYQATEEYLSPANVANLSPKWVFTTGGDISATPTVGQGANNMYALDARTGKILWKFNSGGSVHAGAAVVDGTVYWGSGYKRYDPTSTANNQFYAFRVLP